MHEDDKTRVFLARLPHETNSRDIEKFFRDFKVNDINLKLGYAFVVRFLYLYLNLLMCNIGRRGMQGCQEHFFKISKSDFKNQILGAKCSFFIIFLINLTKFRISKIRFDTEKSDFARIDISKLTLF
jgi:hypothetical protein